MRMPPTCPSCGVHDGHLSVVMDYMWGDGRAECDACGATVYRKQGEVSFVPSATRKAAEAAQANVRHDVEAGE